MNFPLDLRVPDRKSQAAVFYISHSGRVVLVGWVSAVLCDFKVTPKAPREEIRAPLKTPAWEAIPNGMGMGFSGL